MQVKKLPLDAIRAQVENCQACALCETRTNIVFGDGDPHARVLIVGEAPGKNEDLQGKPFVGAAGKFLDELLEEAGLKFILRTGTGITRLRGTVQQAGRFVVLPVFHPAAAIYDRSKRDVLLEDFRQVGALVRARMAQEQDKDDSEE